MQREIYEQVRRRTMELILAGAESGKLLTFHQAERKAVFELAPQLREIAKRVRWETRKAPLAGTLSAKDQLICKLDRIRAEALRKLDSETEAAEPTLTRASPPSSGMVTRAPDHKVSGGPTSSAVHGGLAGQDAQRLEMHRTEDGRFVLRNVRPEDGNG